MAALFLIGFPLPYMENDITGRVGTRTSNVIRASMRRKNLKNRFSRLHNNHTVLHWVLLPQRNSDLTACVQLFIFVCIHKYLIASEAKKVERKLVFEHCHISTFEWASGFWSNTDLVPRSRFGGSRTKKQGRGGGEGRGGNEIWQNTNRNERWLAVP